MQNPRPTRRQARGSLKLTKRVTISVESQRRQGYASSENLAGDKQNVKRSS